MKVSATVIIPTFDHGPMLNFSLPTALNQTVKDLEVFVIGDGAPPITKQIVKKFARIDKRVKWFEFSKDKRHGEIYRHEVLQQAKGRIVCYLSDDDLWLPNHVEVMLKTLEKADFACTLPIRITAAGKVEVLMVDLGNPFYKTFLLTKRNRLPLSFAAHRLDFYRKLPYGWRTAPPSVSSDLYMWRQFLDMPSVRLKTVPQITALNFASSDRRNFDTKHRLRELEAWSKKINQKLFYQDIHSSAFAFMLSKTAEMEAYIELLNKQQKQIAVLTGQNAKLARKLERRIGELKLIKNSRLWRLRSRLSAMLGRQQ